MPSTTLIQELCAGVGAKAIRCTHWADGSKGTIELAKEVVAIAESGKANYKPLYADELPLVEKVRTIAQGDLPRQRHQLRQEGRRTCSRNSRTAGFGNYPVCIAKTQYSFSTDPNAKGAPTGHVLNVRDVRLSAGAEFIVVICGEIMTMPGLPKVPSANSHQAQRSRGRSRACSRSDRPGVESSGQRAGRKPDRPAHTAAQSNTWKMASSTMPVATAASTASPSIRTHR